VKGLEACGIWAVNRTKMFHVKRFGTIGAKFFTSAHTSGGSLDVWDRGKNLSFARFATAWRWGRFCRDPASSALAILPVWNGLATNKSSLSLSLNSDKKT